MAIYKNNRIVIDLTELVEIRSGVINQELSEYEVEQIASALQHTLTWDTLFFMVDTAILDFVGMNPVEYGSEMNESWLLEIERNKKKFKMVELKGNSWTIEVPRRIKE
tara:strand:+ start:80 stop:403 length:324 start_codon:yes stop_codon:yes gene_type:complete